VGYAAYDPDGGARGDLLASGSLGGVDGPASCKIIDKWLARREELNILPANLTVESIRVLYSKG